MNNDKEKAKLLRELGGAIRERGIKRAKKHGNYWDLKLKNKIVFEHDDYNNGVKVFYPDGTRFYFGIDWGGFTGQHVSILHYKATIEMVKDINS